jgi:hypothetical protein
MNSTSGPGALFAPMLRLGSRFDTVSPGMTLHMTTTPVSLCRPFDHSGIPVSVWSRACTTINVD